MKHRGDQLIYCSNLDKMRQNQMYKIWGGLGGFCKSLEMYESKGGLCCFNLKSGQFPSIDFHTFFRYLATESMGPKQFPVVLFHKAANYCKLTKFRCFKNRTARLRISFRDALKFVAFNFRRKGAESFGSNKKYLNSTLF